MLIYPPEVQASWLRGSGSYSQYGTMGYVLNVFNKQIASIGGIFQLICWILALIFAASGIMKIKDHIDAPSKVSIREPLMRLLVGSMFVSLPTIINIIINSTVGSRGYLDLRVDI